MIVAGLANNQTQFAPPPNFLFRNAEKSGDLRDCEQARGPQPVIVALYAIVLGNGLDPTDIESISFPSSVAALIQAARHLGPGVAVKQPINLCDNGWIGRAPLWSVEGDRQLECSYGAALEPNVHRDLLVFDQRHVLQDEVRHAFPLTIRRIRIAPEPWKVRGKAKNLSSLFLVQGFTVHTMLPLVFLLSFGQSSQLVVPIAFEGVRYEAIVWIDLHITALSQIGVVARTLYLRSAQTVGLVEPRLNLLLHCQRYFQRQRADSLHQQLANRLVDCCARDLLALVSAARDLF